QTCHWSRSHHRSFRALTNRKRKQLWPQPDSSCGHSILRCCDENARRLFHFSQNIGDDAQALLQEVFIDNDWWQEAPHVAVGSGSQGNDALLACFDGNVVNQLWQWFFSCWVDHLNRHHGATAADVTNACIVFLNPGEVLGDDFTDTGGFSGHALFFHGFKRGDSGGNGDRVTTVGSTQATGVDGIHHFGATSNSR